MFKRTSVAVMIVAAIFCLVVGNASARTPDDFGNGDGRSEKIYRHDFPKPPASQPDTPTDTGSPDDNWLVYWYVCGTEIETGTPNLRGTLRDMPGHKVGRYLYDKYNRDWQPL